MTGVAKNTVVKLLEDLGEVCQKFHDEHVVGLKTKRVQMAEIWSFCHSKNKNVRSENWGKMHGDVWTWVAMDADAKLVVSWLVDGRDQDATTEFVSDLADRLSDRIQLTAGNPIAPPSIALSEPKLTTRCSSKSIRQSGPDSLAIARPQSCRVTRT
jgi:hypothetical protein